MIFTNLLWIILKKAADNNVGHAELFFDQQGHTSRGIDLKEIINGYYKVTVNGRKLGVDSQLIMCFLKDMSFESAISSS